MQVEWYGQSAFRLEADGSVIAIDPFGDMSAMSASRGIQWDYPPISGLRADLLLITHEHFDHNGAEVVEGDPHVLRSTAGTHESPLGTVTAIASEHDPRAGVERGPNTIFVFEFGGLRVCHMGDFGQASLRPEQREAIGAVELLFVPVGGGPTLGADGARAVVGELSPRWVVPIHYRTPQIGFLETADEFLAAFERVERLDGPRFDTDALPPAEGTFAVVPAAPR